MNIQYLLGGLTCMVLGSWLTLKQIKILLKGKRDELGWDYRILAGGIIFIMGGITLLTKCF